MKSPIDLTGTWHGIFNYPNDSIPPTEFTAEIRDSDGSFSGEISELDSDPNAFGQMLFALLIGQRLGSDVNFVKTYDNDGYDPIIYEGTLADDLNEISGRWDIPRVWSGTFIMIRRSGKADAIKQLIQEEVRA